MPTLTPSKPKGRASRSALLRVATQLARVRGLENFSVRDVTSRIGVAKSMLYACYESRTELVVDLVQEYSATLLRDAKLAGRTTPNGIRRLTGILDMWLHNYVLRDGGCLILRGAIECSGRPDDEIRHAMRFAVQAWRSFLKAQIQDAIGLGEFPPTADQDLLAFEIFSFVLGVQHDYMFLGEPVAFHASGLVAILERHGVGPDALQQLAASMSTVPTGHAQTASMQVPQ